MMGVIPKSWREVATESGWERGVKPLIPRKIADIKGELPLGIRSLAGIKSGRGSSPGSRNFSSAPLSDGSRREWG